eukprot:732526_1
MFSVVIYASFMAMGIHVQSLSGKWRSNEIFDQFEKEIEWDNEFMVGKNKTKEHQILFSHATFTAQITINGTYLQCLQMNPVFKWDCMNTTKQHRQAGDAMTFTTRVIPYSDHHAVVVIGKADDGRFIRTGIRLIVSPVLLAEMPSVLEGYRTRYNSLRRREHSPELDTNNIMGYEYNFIRDGVIGGVLHGFLTSSFILSVCWIYKRLYLF